MADTDNMSKPAAFGSSYLEIGHAIGPLTGVVTFVAAYIYCIISYGFLFGLGLGWLPSLIVAGIVSWTMVFAWGAVLAAGLALLGAVLLFTFGAKNLLCVVGLLVLCCIVWRFMPKWITGG